MILDLDVNTDSILLFVCYVSNRTDISIIFILYLMRFVII